MLLPRKRKSTRFSIANGFPENKEGLISSYCKEFSCDGQSVEKCANKSGIMKVTEALQYGKVSSESEQINVSRLVSFILSYSYVAHVFSFSCFFMLS